MLFVKTGFGFEVPYSCYLVEGLAPCAVMNSLYSNWKLHRVPFRNPNALN